MKSPASFRLTTLAISFAALAGCAGSVDPGTETVVRAPAPQAYEKTITSFFAFKVRGPKKNVEISFGAPEPGGCPLGGYVSSARGWVVPVAYETRTGAPTGPVHINAKQYYFWFLGETIAGITPRIELCPGVGSSFVEVAAPKAAAGGFDNAVLPLATNPDAQRREAAGTVRPSKRQTAGEVRKRAPSSARARGARKIGGGARATAKAASNGKKAEASPSVPEK